MAMYPTTNKMDKLDGPMKTESSPVIETRKVIGSFRHVLWTVLWAAGWERRTSPCLRCCCGWFCSVCSLNWALGYRFSSFPFSTGSTRVCESPQKDSPASSAPTPSLTQTASLSSGRSRQSSWT
uniref:Uncharacterized protein n=1 Tax=Anguilla anguilla TaxID=7936 RepID=A0A0E9XJ42_ANGAN